MKKQLSFLLTIFLYISATAQQGSYFDPAQAYNRLLIEKNNGTYTQISNYKVTGSPYLFGEKNNGNMYSSSETAYNVSLTYNVYNQEVGFYSTANPNTPLVKQPSTLDSFIFKKNETVGLNSDVVFIYGPLLGAKDKNYYQVVFTGTRFNLYKRYTGELGMVPDNIVQANLRQFNVLVDYFYIDSTNKTPKKLKVNSTSLKKEFSAVKDISSYIDNDLLTSQRETELQKIFVELNK